MGKCCLKKTAGLVGGGVVAALFALLSFALFSCSNMSGGGSSSSKNSYPVVRFVANMQSDLATAPQEISGLVSASAGKEASFNDGISRSAMPDVEITFGTDIGVKYYVEAVTGTKGTDSYKRHFVSGTSSTLELPLESGKTWSVTCGIGVIEVAYDPNGNESAGVQIVYMSDSDPSVTISPDKPVYAKTFGLKPTTDGSGSFSLSFYVEPSSGIENVAKAKLIAVCDDPKLAGSSYNTAYQTESGKIVFSSASNIPSGSYEFFIRIFNDESGVLLYATSQTINVFDNMTTNSWRDDGSGAFKPKIVGGKEITAFVLDGDLVTKFVDNTIYVGDMGLGLGPDDKNAGTAFAPLASVSEAFKRIAANGNGNDYRIYISGTVQGCSTLDTDITTNKAKSITIEGYGSGDKLKGYASKLGNIVDFNGVSINTYFPESKEFNPVLTVKTPVPVTIQNLAICEGASNGGSGINIDGSACSVTIKDGVTISGNKTGKSGGGVLVRQGKFYMKGGVIEKNVAFNSLAGNCNGGGVCLRAGAYFEMTGGEIRENRACMGGGVGLVNFDGDSGSNKFSLKRGKISQNIADGFTSSNKCGLGGGIMIMSGSETVHHQVTMTGGEISGNKVNCSSSAVDVSSGTIFEMTGGVIKENSLIEGESDEHYHAIEVRYDANDFCLGGLAYIPAGSGKNHCVYLNGYKDGSNPLQMSKINLDSNLSRHSQSDPLVIQFNESGAHAALRGSLAASASFDLTNAQEYIVPASGDWLLKLSSDKKSLVLDAPIWVAGTGAKQGTGSPSPDGPGKKAQPFDTIDNACAAMTDPNVDYTILIDGTLSGNQTISAANAKSITICGASPLPTTGDDAGIPQDKIDAGGKMEDEYLESDTKGALNIEAAVPVTIKNLMITGGRNNVQGGGIRLSESGADLTLSSGAYVTKNKAKRNGGGVYVGRGECRLTIEDGAVIKENKAINTTITTDNNISCCGGGVYVDQNSILTMTGGTICENSAARGGAGGGVFCGKNVNFSMYGGKICSNSALQGSNGSKSGSGNGGGVYCFNSNFTMTGGVIGDDSTSATATSTDCSNYVDYTSSPDFQQGGGGIYYESSDNSKEMKLLGGTIARNFSSKHGGGVCVKAGKVTVKNTISYNCANEGGGVYNAGAFAMSGGKIYGNSAGKGNGIMVSKFNGQEAQLEIQGCAYLPPDNVICLGEGTSVKITGALTPTDTGASGGAVTCSTATITPTDYDSAILTAADGINLEDWIGYFVITPRAGDVTLSDGLAYGVGVDGKFDTSRILVTKSSNEVRDALCELTNSASGPVNICFATDFKPTTMLSAPLDHESSDQYHGLLKFYEGVTVNLSATKPVVIGESYSDYGSVIVTKKTNLTIGPNIKLVGNRKAEVLYQRGGNVTLNGCEITGSYGSTYAGLFVFATKEYGQALATINEGTKIHHNSGSGIRLQKMSDSSDCPDAILLMTGGEIYANGGNSEYNAGVFVYYGKVTKTGGRIYGNFGYYDQSPNKPSQVCFYKNGYWRNDSSNSYVMYGDGTRWTSEQ
ncbi:MAG: hypothetical protein VZQ47_06915 [Treponema sp.]|nr:hypothetical protein [Treponema sp.]MEE3435270.1 hypothetical protein [Treponema sp.]